MYSVSIEISFCYGHRLQAYDGICKHLHGHNGRAIVSMASEALDAQGMVFDFRAAKDALKSWIDEQFDHTLILERGDPVLKLLQDAGERVTVVEVPPTAENIARLIFDRAEAVGLPVIEVALWETDRCCASYGVARPSPS